MDGRQFLESATRLAGSSHAADLRSAVSRAYYACYHAALTYFASCGVRFSTSSPDAHTKIPMCLDNCNIPVATTVSGKLRSFRDDRNCADYDMNDSKFEATRNVELRLALAKEILAEIDTLAAEPNVRRILQAQARALGLLVTPP